MRNYDLGLGYIRYDERPENYTREDVRYVNRLKRTTKTRMKRYGKKNRIWR